MSTEGLHGEEECRPGMAHDGELSPLCSGGSSITLSRRMLTGRDKVLPNPLSKFIPQTN